MSMPDSEHHPREQSEIIDELNRLIEEGRMPDLVESVIEGESLIISANDDSGNPMRIRLERRRGRVLASLVPEEESSHPDRQS
ncbi:MAG: hypothetical protein DRO87_08545 [Candidatus Thorarchaeota archaeon]|nr:MAG: hypothetical protein DRO87_08545 [Candidatus Thorarchaeota archaeon]RLI58265.1 MAG: hypothetical protein DRP09_00585 [Candidatus Thorarchaeota archaeon]